MFGRCGGVGKPVEILAGGQAGTGTPSGPVGRLELEELVGLWASWKAPPCSPDQLVGARQVPW